MLPPESIVRAAMRWLHLLRSSTLSNASGIIRSDPGYTDLTLTQYANGLEWLQSLYLIGGPSNSLEVRPFFTDLPEQQLNQLLFERIVERASPSWLPDSDLLFNQPSDLPQDATALADLLGLSERTAFTLIRHVRGRIDLEERKRVGDAGERELIAVLESRWSGSTTHVAATDDGFGYDILFRHRGNQWHLEVKSTTRRGRLEIFLSRNEHEVGLHDPYWRLLVVGLDDKLRLRALAMVQANEVLRRAPLDTNSDSKWQSVSHQLTSQDLRAGLHFTKEPNTDREILLGCAGDQIQTSKSFAWMPSL